MLYQLSYAPMDSSGNGKAALSLAGRAASRLRERYSRRHPGFQFCSIAQRSLPRPIEGSTPPPRGMNRVDSVETYRNTGNSSGCSG